MVICRAALRLQVVVVVVVVVVIALILHCYIAPGLIWTKANALLSVSSATSSSLLTYSQVTKCQNLSPRSNTPSPSVRNTLFHRPKRFR